MSKSILKLLQEAITEGDLEKVAALTQKLVKIDQAKVKSKFPSKLDNNLTVDESDYIAPSRKPDQDNYGGRKFIGPDGKEHVYARRVSMSGVKFTNNFDPQDYKGLPASLEQFDKKQQKRHKPIRRRPPATKVKARCSICHEEVWVYSWEIETVDGQSNYRCSKRSCVKAR